MYSDRKSESSIESEGIDSIYNISTRNSEVYSYKSDSIQQVSSIPTEFSVIFEIKSLTTIEMSILTIYWIVSLLHVYGTAFSIDNVKNFTKPFLMPILLAFLFTNRRKKWSSALTKLSIGLVFAFLGDVFLMGPTDKSEIFFLLGLVFFLFMQLFYVFSFNGLPGEGFLSIYSKFYLLPYLFICAIMNYVIKDTVKELQFPVLIYSICLGSMACSAMNTITKLPFNSGHYIHLGAFLFLSSDSIIALDKFNCLPSNDSNLYQVLIMVTYIIAQYLIVKISALSFPSFKSL
jgi:uncharacterized membrane protein YhhN